MKEEDLSRLLEKYYKGETSEDDEFTLKEYFRGDNIPDAYEAEKEIFRHYSSSDQIPQPSSGFEERIISAIEAGENGRKSSAVRKIVLYSLSSAAGLLIMALSYFFFDSRKEPKDTFSDPKIAYAETMKILFQVSAQLNKGNQSLEPLGKMNEMTTKSFKSINKTSGTIRKSLKNLEYLDKADGISVKSADINSFK